MPATERHEFGQLLAQIARLHQNELLGRLRAAGITDARVAHAHVAAYIEPGGSRLSELATRAGISLPAMSELVDELERLGIVERHPDPGDGRAKLIVPTASGSEAIRTTRRVIAGIEAGYAQQVGPNRFEAAARALDDLLGSLDPR